MIAKRFIIFGNSLMIWNQYRQYYTGVSLSIHVLITRPISTDNKVRITARLQCTLLTSLTLKTTQWSKKCKKIKYSHFIQDFILLNWTQKGILPEAFRSPHDSEMTSCLVVVYQRPKLTNTRSGLDPPFLTCKCVWPNSIHYLFSDHFKLKLTYN